MTMPQPRRRLRSSVACDYCHRRRIKCHPALSAPTRCQSCHDFDIPCSYERPMRRGHAGGVAPSSNAPFKVANRDGQRTGSSSEQFRHTNTVSLSARSLSTKATNTTPPDGDMRVNHAWVAFAQASQASITGLIEVFFKTVYPIFPFFSRNTLDHRLKAGEHLDNRAFFASTMAACGLASARVRDGAFLNSATETNLPFNGAPTAEAFLAAARDALPVDLLTADAAEYARTYALLAIGSIQNGDIQAMQKYIGHYFSLMAIRRYHDEANWPADLTVVQKDEMRRLYWSMYTLDIFSSIIWDGCPHYHEAHAKVEYPTGLYLATSHEPAAKSPAWIDGWNFTTDLYRILEHLVNQQRTRGSRFDLLGDTSFSFYGQAANLLNRVNAMYGQLPLEFKMPCRITGDQEKDIFGFQVANIQATMALLRMVCLSLEAEPSVEQKCAVVSEILSTLQQVPTPYLRAISTPLIYHLGGIGTILGTVIVGPLSESSYRRVRELLVTMADLLESMEAFLFHYAGAGRRLRDQMSKIDNFMETFRPNSNVQSPAPLQQGSVLNLQEVQLEDLSPQFQLPDELLQDWTWPFSDSQHYFSF